MDAMYWCLAGGGAVAVVAAAWAILRSGAQVKLPAKDGNYVPFYDFKTRSVTYIRDDAIRPGMIQAKIHNLDGLHWVDASQMKQAKTALGELTDEARGRIPALQAALSEVHPMSIEQWEALVRRDADPAAAVENWSAIAGAYVEEAAAPGLNALQRADLFRLVLACANTPRDQILKSVTLNALARTTAEAIIARRAKGG
ncbi:MAG: hypothetical protein H0W83_08395 [Planctomycetes bacterium]|nr:hypothetical protein [Planctomycetota bacterium]